MEPIVGYGTILSTISWLMAFLASGVTTQVAQRKGVGDTEGARQAVSQGLNLAVFLGFATALIVGLAAPQLAKLVGGKNLVLASAVTYLRVAALRLPAIAVTFAVLGWFRGIEDLRLPVRVVIGANIANVGMEIFGMMRRVIKRNFGNEKHCERWGESAARC